MDATSEVYRKTNWKLLSQQKLALMQAIDLCGPSVEMATALNGILNWIDALQDAAEIEGYPVVWLDK